MSFNTPESFIRKLITEAETFNLEPDTAEPGNPVDSTGVGDLNMPKATPVPHGGTPQMIPAPSSVPQASTAPAETITKTVINSQIILSYLKELKSVVDNYIKEFKEDIVVQDAQVSIVNIINSLAHYAENFNKFLTSEVTPPEPVASGEPKMGEKEPPPIERPEMPAETSPEIPLDFEGI